MAIIEGIQICIPPVTGRVDSVLRKMESLLRDRYHRTVSRREFITRWRKLRIALQLTNEYQNLQREICHDANGMCEYCKVRAGEHMHHLTPVAFAPRRALDRKNVKWTCVSCHEDADIEARARATNRRRPDRAAEQHMVRHASGPAQHLPSGRPDR